MRFLYQDVYHCTQCDTCAVPRSQYSLLTQQQHSPLCVSNLACAASLQVNLPEGELVISPLREKWLQRTGDLLADTFVDAKGIQPYRWASNPVLARISACREKALLKAGRTSMPYC